MAPEVTVSPVTDLIPFIRTGELPWIVSRPRIELDCIVVGLDVGVGGDVAVDGEVGVAVDIAVDIAVDGAVDGEVDGDIDLGLVGDLNVEGCATLSCSDSCTSAPVTRIATALKIFWRRRLISFYSVRFEGLKRPQSNSVVCAGQWQGEMLDADARC